MPFMIKNRNGYGMIGAMLAIVAMGALIVPLTRWYITMTQGTEGLRERLEMHAAIQDYWQKINAATFDEFNAAISSRGTTWEENIGDKYKLTIKFSADGKYADGACSVGTAAGANDRHCRKATITLASKTDPSVTQSLTTTKISTFAESQVIKELRDRLAAINAKFGNYYTAAQINSKRASYYTAAEENQKKQDRPGMELSGEKYILSNCSNPSYSYHSWHCGASSGFSPNMSYTFTKNAYCALQVYADFDFSMKLNGKTVMAGSPPTGLAQFGLFAKKGDTLYMNLASGRYGGFAIGYCFTLK